MRWFVILVAVLLVISPAQPQNNGRTSEQSATFTQQQRDDIREAVFRYQFRHNASIQGSEAAVYCLSVEDGADPSDDFMKRFAGFKPPLRKDSECSSDPYKGVVEKTTGKSGLVFWIRNIKWISPTAAEVVGGYYEYGLSASGNTYTLARTRGRWRVTKAWMNWLS